MLGELKETYHIEFRHRTRKETDWQRVLRPFRDYDNADAAASSQFGGTPDICWRILRVIHGEFLVKEVRQ